MTYLSMLTIQIY